MTANMKIPAEAIPVAREALFSLMGEATGELAQTLTRPHRSLHGALFARPREQLEDVLALLDLIGWAPDDEHVEVEIDLYARGRSIAETLDRYRPALEDEVQEAVADDERRAEHGKPLASPDLMRELAVLGRLTAILERSSAGSTPEQSVAAHSDG